VEPAIQNGMTLPNYLASEERMSMCPSMGCLPMVGWANAVRFSSLSALQVKHQRGEELKGHEKPPGYSTLLGIVRRGLLIIRQKCAEID
jgi:hypothetical protein